MKKKKEPSWGGYRPGSGRKKLEPTVTISFRAKTKYTGHLKQLVKAEIKRLEGDG